MCLVLQGFFQFIIYKICFPTSPFSSQKYRSDRFWFFTIIHQFIYCLHLNFTSVCNSSNFMKLNLLTVLCTISILQIGLQPVSQFTQIIHIQFLPLSADCFLILHEAPLSIRMLQSQLAVKCHPVHIPQQHHPYLYK